VRTRRPLAIAVIVVVGVAAIAGRPAVHLISAWRADRRSDLAAIVPAGLADDASHLNRTRVAEIVDVAASEDEALRQIRGAYGRARATHTAISIAGFRHSMGGQTIAANGIVLNMLGHDHVHYDAKSQHLTVGAGATWDAIIPYLDRFGRAVAIMQSDAPFSLGGSLSVNCHGWQPLSPPIVASVESFTLVPPDGQVRHCSRTENRDLFALVIGGYGLFGVILDVELRTVPNRLYRFESFLTSIDAYEATFATTVERRDSGLAYGRLGVGQDGFFGDAVISTWRPTATEPPTLARYEPSSLERPLFRGSVRSAYGKRLRWWSEKVHDRATTGVTRTRNDLMNGDIGEYVNRSAADRDILHEYFVPHGQLAPFLHELDTIIHDGHAELLNATIRDVRQDGDTVLAYARTDVFAVVLFFAQRPTPEDEQRMQVTTTKLIDAVLHHHGTYYLPYRLHATPAQFRAAYPRCTDFFRAKRAVDPELLLRNAWFERYGEACR
jgi:FAD/FMN-containing dehydrogenase